MTSIKTIDKQVKENQKNIYLAILEIRKSLIN
jgi:hypothetical protein